MKKMIHNSIHEPAERVAYLIAGYIRKTLSPTEHDELDNWVNENDANMKLFEDLTDEKNIAANLKWMEQINSKAVYEKLKSQQKFDFGRRKTSVAGWMVAASVLLITVGYFLYNHFGQKQENEKSIVQKAEDSETAILSDGVLLTLADGTVIDLSKANNGIIEAGHASKENDSVLNYRQSQVAQTHILKTPPGKIFRVQLPDGSNVWLNAASSLKYPTAFTADERVVTLEGEGYFEVAGNNHKPFRVIMTDSSFVKVTGTQFNINDYRNNSSKDVTLVEGKVTVAKANKMVELSPGYQVSIQGERLGKAKKADISEVLGWKNGLFVFKDAGIKEIMAQLEQWYGIQTIYKANINHAFNASFSRSDHLTKILKLLELNGHVHFKSENQTVYVLP